MKPFESVFRLTPFLSINNNRLAYHILAENSMDCKQEGDYGRTFYHLTPNIFMVLFDLEICTDVYTFSFLLALTLIILVLATGSEPDQ